METETKDQVPFVDILVKMYGNKLITYVFKERTQTDQYICTMDHIITLK